MAMSDPSDLVRELLGKWRELFEPRLSREDAGAPGAGRWSPCPWATPTDPTLRAGLAGPKNQPRGNRVTPDESAQRPGWYQRLPVIGTASPRTRPSAATAPDLR